LLLAFKHVIRQTPSARLILIGDGPYRREINRQITAQHLHDRVVCLGQVVHSDLMKKNLPRLGDVFVTASTTENQPVSILEAMAFGLPIVGPRARGIPELVSHGRNGYLFRPDDAHAMATWMTKLAKSPGLCRRMGQTAVAATAEHQLDQVVTRLEKIYTNVILSGKTTGVRVRAATTADSPIVS
jgi:glycosyltransferase involved in cell wall biosynthesis